MHCRHKSMPRGISPREKTSDREKWSMLPRMALDGERLAGLLRTLDALQEKVVRLYFGLGCQRGHSVSEIAGEFGVSQQVIEELLSEAEASWRKWD